jgi:hypothetical protein
MVFTGCGEPEIKKPENPVRSVENVPEFSTGGGNTAGGASESAP